MITWVRSIQRAEGKDNEARQWALDIAQYVNTLGPQHPCQVMRKCFGELGSIMWVQSFENLAEMEAFQIKCWQDEGFVERLKGAEGLYSGNPSDQVYATID